MEPGLNIKVADSGTKVFGLRDSVEYFLMDYSLQVGDTLKTNYGTRTHLFKVLAKTKVKVENDSLWRIELRTLTFITGFPSFKWIESIGCVDGCHSIDWPRIASMSDIGYHLHCVLHKDTSILKQFGKNCGLDEALINPNKKWYTWASNHNGDLKFSVQYNFMN